MQESSPPQGRAAFWWKALQLGTTQLNAAAGWLGLIVLLLGIASVVVPLVFHLSHWLIAVILLSLLVLVVAEGSYQVWHATDQQRKTAETQRDAARHALYDKRAKKLELEIAQLQQADTERRMAVPSSILIELSLGPEPGVSQAQQATGVSRRQALTAHIENTGERPARNATLRWYRAGEDGPHLVGNPRDLGNLRAGGQAKSVLVLPEGSDFFNFTAIVRLENPGQGWWQVGPGGYAWEIDPSTDPDDVA